MEAGTVTQRDVDSAIARLSNVQGVLTCAVRILDDELSGSPLWEVSEAIHGAIEMIQDSYCALSGSTVSCEGEEV